MSKYTFKQEDDGITITHEVETETAQEVFEMFKQFLLGCGFHEETIDRYLDLE